MTDPIALSRRQFTQRLLTSGAVGVALFGLVRTPQIHSPVLDGVSRLNDRLQAGLFDPQKLAPSFDKSAITVPARYNGILPQAYVPQIDPATWRLAVTGRVKTPRKLDLATLGALPQFTQITRLICIEGWSFVGQWSGPRLVDVLTLVGADPAARYVAFECADGYHTSIDMDTARHGQTLLAHRFLDRPLSAAFGAPLRLRIPTKLGFKNAKNLLSIRVTNQFPSGYWEDQGYNWFAGL